MSIVNRELTKNNEDQQDDLSYFIDKAITCCDNNDIKGIKLALRQLKLMQDSCIIYRHTRRIEMEKQ